MKAEMRGSVWNRSATWGWLSVLLAAFVAWFAMSAGSRGAQGEEAPSDDAQKLGGVERFQTHVSTDKPLYRIGDTVYARAVVLEAHDHKPYAGAQNGWTPPAEVCVIGPKGEKVQCAASTPGDGAVAFQWVVPDGQAGGQYKMRVRWPQSGLPSAVRDFEVRAFRAPRLRQEIQFAREGYGPKSTVEGTLRVKRAEGGIPSGARVTVQARVDGANVYEGTTQVDGTGNAPFRFVLPAAMDRGEGSLTMVVEDGGVRESTSKTIPILLQTLDLAFYPEGGDLIGGVENRVYLEARTPWGKPADIAGRIVDSLGVEVGRYRTEHEGRGVFAFSPRAGETYALRIDTPAGIERPFPLPQTVSDGVALRAETQSDGRVSVQLASPSARDVEVVVSRIDKTLARASASVRAGAKAALTLDPKHDAGGALTVTVFGADGTPVAERLVFAPPQQALKLEVVPNQKRYAPGDKVKLTLRVRDEGGKGTTAFVGTTVSDAAVADLLEDRDLPPDLAAMVLLESDVDELKDAELYLSEDKLARTATDLLLGTQGWRRFAVSQADAFMSRHGAKAKRVLAYQEPRLALATRGIGRGGGGAAFGFGGMDKGMAAPAGAVALEGAVIDAAVAAVPPPAAPNPAPRPNDANHPAPEPVVEEPRDNRNAAPAAQPVAANKQIAKPRRAAQLRKREAKADGRMQLLDMDMEMADEAADENFWNHRGQAFTRIYAHQRRAGWKPTERVDFADTVYWSAAEKTSKKGELEVSFDLSDSVSTFAVRVAAYTADGRLGTALVELESVEPFYAEPKLPLEVTSGDVVELPIAVVNATDAALGLVGLELSLPKGIRAGEHQSVSLAANQRGRITVPLKVGMSDGGTVAITTEAGAHRQRVERPLSVVPKGFPVEVAKSGMLEPGGTFTWQLAIPSTAVRGSQSSELALYASPAGNLTSAMERLIREPYGCFEQTSSTTYPLVMAQQYFKSHTGVDPALIEKSQNLIDKGYKRLTGFECKKRGYEWFGADPGHEALSAYGLLEFSDMAEVYPVDREMLTRTREWLLRSRNGEGGFERKRRALHTWVVDADASDAYILWALLESGADANELKPEIDSLARRAGSSSNTYVVALAANVLHLADRGAKAKELMGQLAKSQESDGHVGGGTTSIVGSSGQSLSIETTSLATLAWLRDPAFVGPANKAIQWITTVCENGRYGSTQSTVLALRAILAFDKQAARPTAGGEVLVKVDGRQMGSAVSFTKTAEGVIELSDIAEVLEPGAHTIEVSMKGGSPLPVSLGVTYFDSLPPSSELAPLGLDVTLRDTQITEGRTTEVEVKITNRKSDPVPNPIAIIGLPGGVEADIEALKELKKAGTIAAYETRGREVILYWRDLGSSATVALNLRVRGAVPGTYTGPASRAYLYYGDEHKEWKQGLEARIIADARP